MTFTVKHALVSGKADGLDTSFVQPSNWNADHVISFAADDAFLGRAAGAGPGVAQALSLTQYTVPIGAVIAQAHSTLPASGWLWCNGQTVSRVTYAALFTMLSTTYGAGDGATTYGLPDLRGRVIAGLDNMGGVASVGRLAATVASTTLGATGGQSTNSSAVGVSGTTGGSLSVSSNGTSDATSTDQPGVAGGGGLIVGAGGHVHAINNLTGNTSGNLVVSATGTTGTFSVTQPAMMMNFIIRY